MTLSRHKRVQKAAVDAAKKLEDATKEAEETARAATTQAEPGEAQVSLSGSTAVTNSCGDALCHKDENRRKPKRTKLILFSEQQQFENVELLLRDHLAKLSLVLIHQTHNRCTPRTYTIPYPSSPALPAL